MNKLTPAQAHCVCYTYQDKTLSVPYNTTNVQNNPHDGATHCFRDRWAQSEFSHKRVEKQLLNCSISFLLLLLNLWAPIIVLSDQQLLHLVSLTVEIEPVSDMLYLIFVY